MTPTIDGYERIAPAHLVAASRMDPDTEAQVGATFPAGAAAATSRSPAPYRRNRRDPTDGRRWDPRAAYRAASTLSSPRWITDRP